MTKTKMYVDGESVQIGGQSSVPHFNLTSLKGTLIQI